MVNDPGQEPLRVVIADDHAATRIGIRASLEADGLDVVAEASNGRAAVELALAHRPDVCLLDVHMPGSGIEAAERVTSLLPRTAVVMLTYSRDEEDLFDALRAGARGFLVKDMNPDRLGAALRGVLAGEAALPRTLVATVLDEFRGRAARRRLPRGPSGAQLTSREWEIMELLEQGLSTDDIAERLVLSRGTVRVHVSNVLKKLRAPNRQAAIDILNKG